VPLSQTLSSGLDQLRARLLDPSAPAVDDPTLLWAAVAVVLVRDPEALLLIRRSEREGDPWSGHMALPGGRRHPGDVDLMTTAIRETQEEVGIRLEARGLIGCLEDVIPRTPVLPPIAVRPFVFVLASPPALSLSPEVAGTRWIGLPELLNPSIYNSIRLNIRGENREFPAYRFDDEAVVWGMTERILSALVQRLRT
jgi:8-oxo-dGTP pyrophosphatase MutT (NUDIX family)